MLRNTRHSEEYNCNGSSSDFYADFRLEKTNVGKSEGLQLFQFDTMFNDTFGASPKQLILKQRTKNIKYFLLKPEVTFSNIMIEFEFDSCSHFNRFCGQQFGCYQTEMLKKE